MTTSEQREETVRQIRSREKRNNYTQGRPCFFYGKPEGTNPGYGDCSGSVREIILRVTGMDIGSNTSAQVDNALKGKGVIVERPAGNYFDESKLQPGDCLYFKGNPAHTLSVGHVEMYTGKNECYGHGGGVGPTKKNLKVYCAGRTGAKKALMAVRWIRDDGSTAPLPKLGDRPLVKGCKGEDVKEMQNILLRLGYSLPRYGADGDYGSETAAAVRNYQMKEGLAQTGNAELTTIKAIRDSASGKPVAPAMQIVKVSGGQAWIRSGPGTNHKGLDVAVNGSAWDFSGQIADGWVGVRYDGCEAWISAKYAEVL